MQNSFFQIEKNLQKVTNKIIEKMRAHLSINKDSDN